MQEHVVVRAHQTDGAAGGVSRRKKWAGAALKALADAGLPVHRRAEQGWACDDITVQRSDGFFVQHMESSQWRNASCSRRKDSTQTPASSDVQPPTDDTRTRTAADRTQPAALSGFFYNHLPFFFFIVINMQGLCFTILKHKHHRPLNPD